MSLFHRGFYAPDTSFTPLFRLLDDFDSYSRDLQGNGHNGSNGRRHRRSRVFNPKFDVRETETAYVLHGELPGIARDNVNIEFTDPQTVVVSGRVERSYTAGTPPAGLVEDAPSLNENAITEAGEADETAEDPSHKASVADEADEEAREQGVPTPTETPELAKAETAVEAPAAKTAPSDKYWVSERSVGEFSRTFSFPSRIDQDGVKASLDNGVLTVSVPKARKHESRRIAID